MGEGAGCVSGLRLAWAHLGLYGGPFPVADLFLEAGQERRLSWPHVRHLVPFAHGHSGKKLAPRSRLEIVEATAPTSDVTSSPPPDVRPGNMAASVLASTSYLGAKFKFAAILSGRNPVGAARLEARAPTALV